jgi:acyl-CoA thioester hydrolase
MEELLKEYNVVSTAKAGGRWMRCNTSITRCMSNGVKWPGLTTLSHLAYFRETKVKIRFLGFQSVKYIIPVVYPDTIHIGTKSRGVKPIGLC